MLCLSLLVDIIKPINLSFIVLQSTNIMIGLFLNITKVANKSFVVKYSIKVVTNCRQNKKKNTKVLFFH